MSEFCDTCNKVKATNPLASRLPTYCQCEAVVPVEQRSQEPREQFREFIEKAKSVYAVSAITRAGTLEIADLQYSQAMELADTLLKQNICDKLTIKRAGA